MMKLKYDLSRNSNLNMKPALWNVKEHRLNELLDHLISIFPICISGIIIEYDYNFECKLDCVLTGHSRKITSTCFYNENKILSVSNCLSPKLWDLAKSPLHSITIPISFALISGIAGIILNKNNTSYVCIIAYSQEINSSGIFDYNITIWRNLTNNDFENLDNWIIDCVLVGHTKMISSIVMIDDYRLASGSIDSTIRIWNLYSGNCEIVLSEHTGTISRMISLSKNRFASISSDETIKVWNVITYKCECTLASDKNTLFVGISYNQDENERIITLSHESIKIWSNENTNAYKCIKNIKYKYEQIKSYFPGLENIRILQNGKNGKIVVIFNNEIKIFSVFRNESDACDVTLTGHTDKILAITILPDGKIVSSSLDKTIRIWDVSYESKKLISCEVLYPNSSNEGRVIYYLKVLPDGRLIGYSLDNTMIIWK
jgi:WD40 repeat protein